MNAHRNASNLGNPAPSQGGNVENVGADGGIDDRINQIAAPITHMATMLTQVNGMLVPLAVKRVGVEIPRLEAFHQN